MVQFIAVILTYNLLQLVEYCISSVVVSVNCLSIRLFLLYLFEGAVYDRYRF